MDPNSEEFFFPNCWGMLDHLHILFNALESGIEKLPWWPEMLELLRSLCTFFGTKEHRDRFQAECLDEAHTTMSEGMPPAHEDWRWEI